MTSGRLPPGTAGAHLWPRMAGDQAGQLQRLALADGVDPLRVAFLLDVARQARVHDPHSGGGCKTQREKPGERHPLHPRALLRPISMAAAWDPLHTPQLGGPRREPSIFTAENTLAYSAGEYRAPEGIATVFFNT